MSVAANVKSIQLLADLKTSLARYGADAQQMLAQMERTIDETRQSLVERQRHWQQQVRRCEAHVAEARSAFSRCQNSAYTDHTPDCRQSEQAVLAAKRQLERAVGELRNVEQASKQVEAAIADYTGQGNRCALGTRTPCPSPPERTGRPYSDSLSSIPMLSIPSSLVL